MHARVCSTCWQLLQWEVRTKILTNDICVTVFELFDPVAYDHFKKRNTLACHTSSVLEKCLNSTEPAKLHWGSVSYCCVMCIQLQQCFPSQKFTHVSNFPIANRVTLALNMQQRLQDSEWHDKTKDEEIQNLQLKYLQNRCDNKRNFLCLKDWEMCFIRELKYMKLLQWHYVLFDVQWVHQNCLNSCKLSVQSAIITSV